MAHCRLSNYVIGIFQGLAKDGDVFCPVPLIRKNGSFTALRSALGTKWYEKHYGMIYHFYCQHRSPWVLLGNPVPSENGEALFSCAETGVMGRAKPRESHFERPGDMSAE
jgi:hypothetical protein